MTSQPTGQDRATVIKLLQQIRVVHNPYSVEELEAFFLKEIDLLVAALTQARQEGAVQGRYEERERCARLAETRGVSPALNIANGGPEWYKHGKDIAQAIRAGGGA